MPANKGVSRRQTVGKAFAIVDETKSVGRKFSEKDHDELPLVLILDRSSLKAIRDLAIANGWPRRAKIAEAILAAQRKGLLSVSPVLERYGGQQLAKRSFMVLPVLDGREETDAYKTFRAWSHDGTLVLYPPGQDPWIAPARTIVPAVNLNITFFPFGGRQEDALAATEFEVLFGGAKGGAKTEYIVAAAGRQVDRPAYKALIFRKTELALEEVENRAKAIYEPLGAQYFVADRLFVFPSGAKIELGYIEEEAGADRYQGREFPFIGGDEFTQVADPKVRTRLISECRCPDPDVVRMVRWTANPIGPGVANMKKLFIGPCGQDGSKIHRDTYEIEGIGEVVLARRFIPSRVTDNPVYSTDPTYMATLSSLPDRMKRLLLHGDWSAALGAALDELSRAKHWKPWFEIPAHWKVYGFFDWGFAHRWCFIFIAIDEDGGAWVVDTLWGHREYADDIAERITDRMKSGHTPLRPRPVYASKDAFQRYEARSQNLPTFAEQFAVKGLPMMPANESSGSRVTGLNNLRQWLAWEKMGADGKEGDPRLKFLATHGNEILFQQLEAMVPDPDNPEDVLKVDYNPDDVQDGINFSGDDGYDTLKMFANIRPMAAKRPDVKLGPRKNFDEAGERSLNARSHRRLPARNRGF